MTERTRDTGDELILYDDQHALLRVTRPTRLLGAAYGGVHVLPGGTLVTAGIIRQRLVVESGGACYASGYIRAVPKVAAGGLLEVTGHLGPVRWPEADIAGTILVAVGARYGERAVAEDGTLAPFDPATSARINESTPQFRIVRSGPTPTLEGPLNPAPLPPITGA
ncbi:MAG: hypothetical protein QM638_02280 [Nocardioides sp.]|uniref:hypothetical protein n=1 Tax=Nocardioides sp. TaxID=35761 RepID=UPI0039E25C72